MGVLAFRLLDDLRVESGGVSNNKGSAISSGEIEGIVSIRREIFDSTVVTGVAGSFLGIFVDFD